MGIKRCLEEQFGSDYLLMLFLIDILMVLAPLVCSAENAGLHLDPNYIFDTLMVIPKSTFCKANQQRDNKRACKII